MPGVASAATAVVHRARRRAAPRRIRVGAGGIMLPNHAPLVRSPSSSARWSRCTPAGSISAWAARRAPTRPPRARCAAPARRSRRVPRRRAGAAGATSASRSPASASGPCRARDCEVPVWILGSSMFGAQLAAALGLPFAFASHFAPAMLDEATRLYRERFTPFLPQPGLRRAGAGSPRARARPSPASPESNGGSGSYSIRSWIVFANSSPAIFAASVEAHVDPRRDAGGGDHLALLDHAPAGGRGAVLGERVELEPVRGRLEPVEHARRRRAAASRCTPTSSTASARARAGSTTGSARRRAARACPSRRARRSPPARGCPRRRRRRASRAARCRSAPGPTS